MVSKDMSESDLVRSIAEYLKAYEEVYPLTMLETFKAWIEDKVKMIRGEIV